MPDDHWDELLNKDWGEYWDELPEAPPLKLKRVSLTHRLWLWWHGNRFAAAYNNRCWACLWRRPHP